MRERQESEALQKQYLDFLRNLLKDQQYVALVYMTGILPVKKYGQHSALNMFWEYSMTDQFAFEEYTGFTEDEVKALCEKYNMDFAQTSNWYDGYRFLQFRHIYNPRSVVAAMKSHVLSNYWTATETYDALKIYIDMDFDGLRSDIVQMLGGGCARVNTRSFQNDMQNFRTKDDVLTLLIHLGYLAYDSEKEEAFIPNKEIVGEFENAMSVSGWPEIMRILKASDKLLRDTLDGDADSVARGLDQAHTEAASILTYNDENSQFLSNDFLVVELKYDRTVNAAIRQIKDRHYTQALEGYMGEILAVGINYDRDDANKHHSCVIERLEKR